MTRSRTLRIAGLTIRPSGTSSRDGTTTSNEPSSGTATLWEIKGPEDLHLLVADTRWDTGERDLATIERNNSPPRYDRLTHGLRLGVQTHESGLQWVELRHARLGTKAWPTLHTASLVQLSHSAATNVAAAIEREGGSIGTRGELLDDKGRRREHLCATFPPTADRVPIVSYTLTRVAPIRTQRWA